MALADAGNEGLNRQRFEVYEDFGYRTGACLAQNRDYRLFEILWHNSVNNEIREPFERDFAGKKSLLVSIPSGV
jgi:hypothetical protein